MLLVMSKCREHEDLYHVIIDPIDEPVLLCDSPGIDRTVISFQRFDLAGPRSGMLTEFIEESGQFG